MDPVLMRSLYWWWPITPIHYISGIVYKAKRNSYPLWEKNITDTNPEDTLKLWTVPGTFISMIYRITDSKHAESS